MKENIKIPKKIHQTHISEDWINKNEPRFIPLMKSCKNIIGYDYEFYTDEQAREMIRSNFDKSVFDIYEGLPRPVMKADFWRYCVIYLYGGVYLDTDVECPSDMWEMNMPDKELILIPENKTHICNWMFSAVPKHPALKLVIDLMTERLSKNWEDMMSCGKSYICKYTGPGVFTSALVEYFKTLDDPVIMKAHSFTEYMGASYDSDKIFILSTEVHKRIKHHYAGQWHHKPNDVKNYGWLTQEVKFRKENPDYEKMEKITGKSGEPKGAFTINPDETEEMRRRKDGQKTSISKTPDMRKPPNFLPSV